MKWAVAHMMNTELFRKQLREARRQFPDLTILQMYVFVCNILLMAIVVYSADMRLKMMRR